MSRQQDEQLDDRLPLDGDGGANLEKLQRSVRDEPFELVAGGRAERFVLRQPVEEVGGQGIRSGIEWLRCDATAVTSRKGLKPPTFL